MQPKKVFGTIRKWRRSPQNIRFVELTKMAEQFGFNLKRIVGSHHIYAQSGVVEILNFQQDQSGKAKPYQVRQLVSLIEKYQLQPKGEKQNEI